MKTHKMLRILLLGASLMTSASIYIGLKIVTYYCYYVVVVNVNSFKCEGAI